jgi:D-alanyl-D-alanine dipeptidase
MRYCEGAAEPMAALNRVEHIENGEPLVDLREAISGLRVLRDSAVPWARESVAKKFAKARSSVAPFDIGLREAWRSPERQKFIYDHYFNSLPPESSLSVRRRRANRFFAPYDQKAPPGHSTGGALDVWLLEANGEPISLNGPGQRFRSAPTFSTRLPEDVREKRVVLYTAMTAVGFTNCRDEWWHYSFGDAGWAVRIGSPTCIYGAVRPNPETYVEKDRVFIEEFLKDPPF